MAQNNSENTPPMLEQARAAYAAGALDDAEMLYNLLLCDYPEHVEANAMTGMIQAHRGNLAVALASLDKAVALDPVLPRLRFFRGNVLEHLQRYDEALSSYLLSAEGQPDFAPTHLGIGVSLAAMGRFAEALEAYGRALSLEPDYAEAYFNRGNSYRQLQRYEEAVENYRKACSLAPLFAPFHNNLGVALKQLQQVEQAIQSHSRAIELQPGYYQAINNLGAALHAAGRYGEALEQFDRVIKQEPRYPDAYNNKGNSLRKLQRHDEALAHYNMALNLNPNYAEACNNKAYCLQELNHFDDAMHWYERALALSPNYLDAAWNKSTLHLMRGDFEEGLRLYETRMTRHHWLRSRLFSCPPWQPGTSLAGKTLLLYAEQGMGDTIQYVRYLPMIKAMGAIIILEAPLPLHGVLSSLDCDFALVELRGEVLPYDAHYPLMSLPYALGTRVETIPAAIPYLFAREEKRRFWREKLGSKKTMRIGVCWSGNREHANDINRSIKLEEFAMLFRRGGKAEFHAVQKDMTGEESAFLQRHNVGVHAHDLQDFADTAALIAEMDMIISVDTAVAHLAGAMGKPLWLLVPFVSDFRWLVGHTDSPWYPTARIFWQKAIDAWPATLKEAGNVLEAVLANG